MKAPTIRCFSIAAAALCWTETAGAFTPTVTKIHGRTLGGEALGAAVDTNRQWIAIGEEKNSDVVPSGGAVQIYDARTGRHVRKLTQPSPVGGDRFGSRVAVLGNLCVVGAPRMNGNAGLAFVFDILTGRRLATLEPTNPVAGDQFGNSVAARGRFIAIGAPGRDDPGNGADSGAVHLFDATTFAEVRVIRPVGGQAGDSFGWSVALDRLHLVVGAPNADHFGADSGDVYVFNVETGAELPPMIPGGINGGDRLGFSVAIEGRRLVVGAPEATHPTTSADAGIACLFEIDSGIQLATLASESGSPMERFGHAVALDGPMALIGAPNAGSGGNSGEAYLFATADGSRLRTLIPPDTRTEQLLGTAVSLRAGRALVGAPGDPQRHSGSGALYAWSAQAAPASFESLARVGDLAAGAVDAEFAQIQPPVSASSGFSFGARLAGVGSDRGRDAGYWLAAPSVNAKYAKRRDNDFGMGPTFQLSAVTVGRFLTQTEGVFQGRIAGPGINRGNDDALFRFDAGSRQIIFREGQASSLATGGTFRGFGGLVQVGPRWGFGYTLIQGVGGIGRANDSGILPMLGPTVEIDTLAEGQAAIGGGVYGQFPGRLAHQGTEIVFPSFRIDGIATPPAAAAYRKSLNAADALLAKAGDFVPSLGGPTWSSFQAESADGTGLAVLRATVTAGPGSRPQQILHHETFGLIAESSPPVPNQTTISRLIKFWPFGAERIVFLAQLAGPGINRTNDLALFLLNEDGNSIQLFREGEHVGDSEGSRIGTILRVSVDASVGNYLILASLTGDTARNLGIFDGNPTAGNPTAFSSLRLPCLAWRKGTPVRSSAGVATVLRSLDIADTTTVGGAGNVGTGSAIDDMGAYGFCITCDNGAKEIVAVR
ncbi:MAG: hypothetical protein JNK37_00285 [Verrucomicrobiales bacterium]|nr:hypothetical protein [Verrucomicrobiales bacterium]